ncbi:MAG: FlgO family outer membrane protein [Aliarcobacter sp.]|nr:FlgO family outer membrane protein [Aliarcobacter sp.]
MIKTFSKISILAILVFVYTGCQLKQRVIPQSDGTSVVTTSFDSTIKANGGNLETPHLNQVNNDLQVTKEYLKLAQDAEMNVSNQRTLESTINSLATQMMRNQKISTVKPILITSFVKLDQFKKTTEFGRVISESLINELSNRGFNVIEFRGQMAVSINEEGEYFISRKPHELKDKIPNTYVVVGTYSRQYKKIILNARVIDNITGKIITSARAVYEHGIASDCILFGDCAPARTVNIVKER